MTQKAKVGRPRSEKSRDAILRAAHGLLNESDGGALSIEGLARRAGVGKPTIYRWWPSLADVVLEALLQQADANIVVPPYTTLGQTLRVFLRNSMQGVAQGGGPHLRYLMAQAQQEAGFRERFRENFVSKRRDILASFFRQATEQGEIPVAFNSELAVDMLFGAMWYRLLVGHAPLDDDFADELTEMILGLVRKDCDC